MKKYYLFIALAMVAAVSVSCKSNKKAESNEANEEVVEAAKTVLADDVLAKIDDFSQTFVGENGKTRFSGIFSSALTEEEKLIKPDYLLNPSEVDNFVTKTQKVNALAILTADRVLMKVYEMPIEEANEAIARLGAEAGFPIPDHNLTVSEKIADEYEKCKESGDLALFWQFQFVKMTEFVYLISQNPDIFFRNISEDQLFSFNNQFLTTREAVKTLAEYDSDIKLAWDTYYKYRSSFPDEDSRREAYFSIDSAKNIFSSNKESYAARRADMLK